MTSKYNPFATSYPSSRGPLGKIFLPVIDYRTYLRTAHMLLMFPLGIAYFVFFVVTLVVGGAMIWTLVGPVVLLATLFISRWLGDLEAFTAAHVNGTPIRRPPSRLEGVSNFRSQIKVRLVDPTTWTGLVYLVAQFPIGIAAFVSLVVMYAVIGALVFAPLIVLIADAPVEIFHMNGSGPTFDTASKALLLTPLGVLGFLLASHAVLTFSSLHGWWARLMLGSRSTRVSSRATPAPAGDDPSSRMSTPNLSSDTDDPAIEIETGATSGTQSDTKPPEQGPSPATLTLVPNPSDIAPDTTVISDLTAREQEVFMLMAHGDTNADIAEELFISEGTVKTHVKRVLSKLDIRDRTQVVVFAYEQRLVVPNSGGGVTLFNEPIRRSVGAC